MTWGFVHKPAGLQENQENYEKTKNKFWLHDSKRATCTIISQYKLVSYK